jgi:hypothetical protein
MLSESQIQEVWLTISLETKLSLEKSLETQLGLEETFETICPKLKFSF